MKLINHNKKGGLQVSINAIVILVMAVVVIGLGITFISNALNPDAFAQITETYKIEKPATFDEPFVLVDSAEVSRGEASRFEIAIFNKASSDDVEFTLHKPDCINSTGGDAAGDLSSNVPDGGRNLTVGANSMGRIDLLISAADAAPLGAYTCDVKVNSTNDIFTESLFIKVKGG